MADVLRIKRRLTGLPGAPAGLGNAELAFNEVDQVLYYGLGGTAIAALQRHPNQRNGSRIRQHRRGWTASPPRACWSPTRAATTSTRPTPRARQSPARCSRETRRHRHRPTPINDTCNRDDRVRQSAGLCRWVSDPTAILDAARSWTAPRPSVSARHTRGTTTFTRPDTSRAPLASPAFTGAPSMPTGTVGIAQTPATSNTSSATTAFVAAAAAAGVASFNTRTGAVTLRSRT